jgi:flagellar biosynthesis/type III secretory pathway protein FliH
MAMDAVIRSAAVAPVRARLPVHPPRPVDQRPDPVAQRAQLERALRAELAVEAGRVLDAERARAREEGRAAGLADAELATQAAVSEAEQKAAASAATTLAALSAAHERAVAQFERSVGEIAFAALCRLLAEQVPPQDLVHASVRRTCAELRGDATAVARLHPEDVETIQRWTDGGGLRGIGLTVVGDATVDRGGCVLDAPSGRYDGGLDSQLRRLHQALTARAGERP